jgi:hypothetical protein
VLSPRSVTATRPPMRPAAAAPDPVSEGVEVRTAGADDGAPQQLLWRGRLWLVQHAVQLEGRQQTERWRIRVADGPAGQVRVAELARCATRGWRLHEDGA